jgi:hypothetical protein
MSRVTASMDVMVHAFEASVSEANDLKLLDILTPKRCKKLAQEMYLTKMSKLCAAGKGRADHVGGRISVSSPITFTMVDSSDVEAKSNNNKYCKQDVDDKVGSDC